jgi:hypothetical protein
VQPGPVIQQVRAALADLNLRYQVLISILPASNAQYQQSRQIFWRNIRREGVKIESI